MAAGALDIKPAKKHDNNDNNSNNPGGGGMIAGLGGGADTDAQRREKADKQSEYARQLQRDHHQQQQQPVPAQSTADRLPGGGGLNFGGGGHSDQDKQYRQDKQHEYALQLQRDQQDHVAMQRNGNGNGNGNDNDRGAHNQFARDQYQRDAATPEGVGGLGPGIGGYEQEQNKNKANKQHDYAAQLQRDQAMKQPDRPDSVPGGGGMNIGGYEQAVANNKGDQQRAYAAQLQRDQMMKDDGNAQSINMPGGGGLAIGGYEQAMAQLKGQRQNDYAAQLQRDQAMKQPDRPDSVPGGGGMNIGGYEQAVANNKGDQQRAYAAQLQRDQAMKRQDTPDMPGGGAGPGMNIGGYEQAVANNKGDQQRAYAAQLQRDQAMKQQLRPDSLPGGGGMAGLGDYQQGEQDHKLDKQAQYADQLRADAVSKAQREAAEKLAASGGISNGMNAIGGGAVDKRSAQAAYAAQLQQQMAVKAAHDFGAKTVQQADLFGQMGSYEEQARAEKRAKQEQYNRALQEQQLLHQQRDAEELLKRPKEPFHSLQQGGSGVPAVAAQMGGEWTMGPLGVPVRKVLEVGDRGRQKAFLTDAHLRQQQIGNNPNPNNAADNAMLVQRLDGALHPFQQGDLHHLPSHLEGGAPLFPGQLPPQQHPEYGINNNPHGGTNGNNNGPSLTAFDNTPGEVLDLQAERDIAKKRQVQEQQRVLEAQIIENRRRLDEERTKREREESEEQDRLERERIEMARAFEQEEKEAAMRADADLQRAQQAQAEAKKREKAEAARLEQEQERAADDKARRESDELFRKAQAELQHEQGLRDHPTGGGSPFKEEVVSVPQHRGQPNMGSGGGGGLFDPPDGSSEAVRRATSPITSPTRSPRSYRSDGGSGRLSDRSNISARFSQEEKTMREDVAAHRHAAAVKAVPPLHLRVENTQQSPNQSIYDSQNPGLPQQSQMVRNNSDLYSNNSGSSSNNNNGLFGAVPTIADVDHNTVDRMLSNSQSAQSNLSHSSQNLNDAIVLQLQNEARRAKREADDARDELRRLQQDVEEKKKVDGMVKKQADAEQIRLQPREDQEQEQPSRLRPDSGILRVLDKQNAVKLSARGSGGGGGNGGTHYPPNGDIGGYNYPPGGGGPRPPLSPPALLAAAAPRRRPEQVWSANRPTRLDNAASAHFAHLDNTLQSDSRFVYPDGTDFRQSVAGLHGNGPSRPPHMRGGGGNSSNSGGDAMMLPEPVPAPAPHRPPGSFFGSDGSHQPPAPADIKPASGDNIDPNSNPDLQQQKEQRRQQQLKDERSRSEPSPISPRMLEKYMKAGLGAAVPSHAATMNSGDREEETPRDVKDAHREVEQLKRRNQRKWEVLKDFDAEREGVEALSLLMGDLDKYGNSRPSSAGSTASSVMDSYSRPGSQYHNYVHKQQHQQQHQQQQQEDGRKGGGGGGLGDIDPFGGMQPLNLHVLAGAGAGAGNNNNNNNHHNNNNKNKNIDYEHIGGRQQQQWRDEEDEEDEEDLAAARARLRAKQAKEQAALNIIGDGNNGLAPGVGARQREHSPLTARSARGEERGGNNRPASGYSRASSAGTNYSDFGL
jgi:hypothetical protein